MKKYSCLLYGLLFFAFVSCKKEDFHVEEISSNSINNSLLGNWYLEDVPFDTLKLKRGYTFKQDNGFEYLEMVINSSGDVLGFRHRLLGKYEVKGDKAILKTKLCPKCNSFMAKHKDRFTCGKCKYTEKHSK